MVHLVRYPSLSLQAPNVPAHEIVYKNRFNYKKKSYPKHDCPIVSQTNSISQCFLFSVFVLFIFIIYFLFCFYSLRSMIEAIPIERKLRK